MKSKILITLAIFWLAPFIMMSQPFGQLVRKFPIPHATGVPSCNKNYLFLGNATGDTIFIYNLNNGGYVGYKKVTFQTGNWKFTETRAYIGSNYHTLVEYDITDIGNWSVVKTVSGLDQGWVSKLGQDTSVIAWVGHWAQTFQLVDISGNQFELKCKVNNGGNAYTGARYGNYIYIGNAYQANTRINITDPSNCTVEPFAGSCSNQSSVSNSGYVLHRYDYCYTPQLYIYNQQNQLTGTIDGVANFTALAIPDDYLLIGNNTSNIQTLYDIYDGTFNHPVKTVFNNTLGEYTFNSTFILRLVNDSCEVYSRFSPNIQASNIAFSNIQSNQISCDWTDGNGSKRAVFIKQDTVGTPVPVYNTTYTANTIFGSGSQIGTSGWYCVFNGTSHASGVTVTNLLPNTNYRVMVCEFNGDAGTEQYNTSTTIDNPKTQKTCSNLIPSNGLVAWFPFNGNAFDASGNGNNGTVSGSLLTTDRFNNNNSAYYFDGNNDYINVPNASSLNFGTNIDFTVNLWINITEPFPSTLWGLVEKATPDGVSQHGWQFLIGAVNKLYSEPGPFISNQSFGGNTWYMITYVVDRNSQNAKYYINGVLDNQNSSTEYSFDFTNTYPLRIGVDRTLSSWGNFYFHGKIDDIRIFNRVLTNCEVQALYQEPNSPSTQATNVIFTNTNTNQFTVNWTDGNGSNRVVFIKQDSVGTPLPSNNTPYNANTAFGSGSQIGTSGWYCVFNGTTHASGITVTNLIPNTKYRVMVCEYNGSTGLELYNSSVSTNNPNNQRTCPNIIPTITGSNTVCLGSGTKTYSTEADMTGYNWNVSSGGQIIYGSGTDNVTVVWNTAGAQTISVSYGNSTGCFAATPTILNVNVIATPEPAGSVSGLTEVCVGTQGVTYSVDTIQNATNYLWKVPLGVTITGGAGTNSIMVNFPSSTISGTISVKGTNVCFTGVQSPNLTVKSNALLAGQVTLNNITIPPEQQECLAAQSITTAGSGTTFLIQGGGEVTLIANQFIRFLPGTTVQETGYLHAIITDQCIPCSSFKTLINGSNLLGATQSGNNTPVINDQSSIIVYPNPTSGSFTLAFDGEIGIEKVQVEIYSLRGEKIITEELIGERRHLFSLYDKPVGVYFIRVITGTMVKTIKVIRQ